MICYLKQLQSIGNIKNETLRIKQYIDFWNSLPEPKYQQPGQISELVIYCIFEDLFDIGDYENAKAWAIKGLETERAKDPISSYEYFQMGRVCYELKEFDEAKKYFSIAYGRGKKRAFSEFDKKYYKFYSESKN